MIVTGPEILAEVRRGRITIDDFEPERLEPNSYAFRLAPDLLRYEQDILECYQPPAARRLSMGPAGLVLEPGRFYLGSTMEAMGSAHYAATLYASRSASTLGLWIQFSAPLGHSGAVFPWTLEMTVAHPVRVYPGMIIGKLAFWSMQGEAEEYRGRYAGSTSAVASRLSEDRPAGERARGEQPARERAASAVRV